MFLTVPFCIRRVREQLTSELRDVESALASLKDKYTDLRSQLQEKEDKLVSSEAFNRSLQTQLVETRKVLVSEALITIFRNLLK